VRIRLGSSVPVLVAALLLAGCYSTGLYETARVAPPGSFEVGGTAIPASFGGSGSSLIGVSLPSVELAGRVGIAPKADMGIRFGIRPGADLSVKYQFLQGQTDGALSTTLSLWALGVSGATVGQATLTPRLVFSGEEPGSFPWAVNAGLGYSLLFTASSGYSPASARALSLLGGVGIPVHVGQSREVRIMPEFSAGIPIIAGTGDSGDLGLFPSTFSLQLGINVQYVGAEPGGSE